MKKAFRLEIITEDRVGMALDILKEVVKINASIGSMEVFPNKVYIKIDKINQDQERKLKENIYLLNGIVDIKENRLMPYEENERKIFAFIDSVDEGIIAINKNKEIEIFNSYCEKIFNLEKHQVIGEKVSIMLPEDAPIIGLFKDGKNYDNLEMKINTNKGQIHYLTTGRSIKDDDGNILGAVASIRDINEVIELVNIVSGKDEDVFKDIIGNSNELEKVKNIIKMISKSNSTVLLRGESGSGKEVFAKSIHSLSDRKDKSLITVNCAALPDNLLESELFGYEEGSFTGALKGGREGLFKQADGGTIFLDEIGELSIVLQAKLLRVLQEGKIRKIGASKEENVDVRIITATNRNLEEMIKNEKFREDLYYRLNVIPIYLPPLRKRKEDIPLLVKFFIDKLNRKINKNIAGFEMDFINKLLEYNWPGNVRELENVIERAINLCCDNVLKLDDLIIDLDYKSNNINEKRAYLKEDIKLDEVVEIVEKEIIIKALNKHKTIRKSAKALGVSHTTLINKIKKYNINWN